MTPEESDRDDHVNRAITEYLEAIEAGRPHDTAAFLARHSEIAAELKAFLADHQRFANLVSPFAVPGHATRPGGEDTLPQAIGPLGTIRYVGDYELLEEVARGGMGVVFKARQVSLKRTVAIKMILAGQFATERDVQRFHTEAEAAARLDHPGIVPIYEIGEHQGLHYFAMAYVEGESLAHRLTRGVFTPREAAELTRQVAQAVAYAHVEGVVHRDLKPANILIDRDGQPRITDFGLAKRVRSEESQTALTATGEILGTPSYMPPEQAAGRISEIGPLSDVYSLGAILYCLLTGRPPFQAANTMETLLQVLGSEPVSPRRLNPTVPRDLETICLKCLEKDPARRPQSASDLAEELLRFRAGVPLRIRPVGVAERGWRWARRHRSVAAAVAAILVILMASSVVSAAYAVRAERSAQEARAALKEKEEAQRRARETALRLVRWMKKNPDTLRQPSRQVVANFLSENPDITESDLGNALVTVQPSPESGTAASLPTEQGIAGIGVFVPQLLGD